jgi:hypothetical protein
MHDILASQGNPFSGCSQGDSREILLLCILAYAPAAQNGISPGISARPEGAWQGTHGESNELKFLTICFIVGRESWHLDVKARGHEKVKSQTAILP